MISHSRFATAMGATLGAALLTACAGADATATDRHAPVNVTVNAPPMTTLSSLGDTARLAVRVVDSDGQALPISSVRWRVRTTSVLEPVGDGTFRAIGNGKTTVVAEVARAGTGVRPDGYFVNALADSVTVTVAQVAARLITSVDTAFTTLGAARTIQAQLADARGNALVGNAPPVLFASANPAVVTVDANGRAKSITEGVSRVTITAGALTGAATFTVSPRRPHTSCMVYAQRTKSAQSCITVQLVMREKETSP